MPKFSATSEARLMTCHPDIIRVMRRAILETDFTVICGWRGPEAQLKAYESGNSKLLYPKSKHNRSKIGAGIWDKTMSDAIDIAPYPIDWKDTGRFKELAKIVLRIAEEEGVKLSWGGHWTKFVDMPHYEIRRT